MELVRGQKIKLMDVLSNVLQFNFKISLSSPDPIDVSIFGLDASSKLSNEDYMIFYNQPVSPCQSIKLLTNSPSQVDFSVNLASLNPKIERLVVTLALDGNGTMSQIGSSNLAITNAQGQVLTNFPFNGTLFNKERAIMLFECYRKDNIWRLNAIAQGFNGGLDKLIEYYGGEVAKDNLQHDTIDSKAPPSSPAVNLTKVTLTKSNSSINLKKSDNYGKISVNLNWNRDRLKKITATGVDLDLGAFIALKDGGLDCIQAVGQQFGSFESYPYICLRNDDRSGQCADGEWLDINGSKWDQIEEVLIYAFIYSGIPHWQETDAIVTLHIAGQQPIETQLTEGSDRLGMCAIARLINDYGEIRVERINRYFASHQAMDKAFNWGFSWVRGSK